MPEPSEPLDEDVLRVGDDPLHALQSRYGNAEQFKLRVYRVQAAGEDEYLFSADGFVDEDFIQGEHGAGRYKLKIYIGDEWRDECTIRIAARPGVNPPGTAPGAPAPAAVPQASDFAQELLLAMVKSGSLGGPPADAGGGVGGMADMVKAIVALKENFGTADPMKYFLDGIAQGRKMGEGSEGDWKRELAATIKDVAPVVASAFRPAPAAPPGAQPVQQPTQEQQLEAINVYVKNAILRIKPQVSMGLQADLAIDWLLNNASDPAYAPLLQLAINQPFEDLQALDDDLAKEPYATWFRSVYDGIRSAYSTQDSVATDPTGESGNESDADGHEDTGAAGKPAA